LFGVQAVLLVVSSLMVVPMVSSYYKEEFEDTHECVCSHKIMIMRCIYINKVVSCSPIWVTHCDDWRKIAASSSTVNSSK
jgi:alpha-D-ribose 1-methylphosphonate 5-triphosphate synthase subunit PhnL